MTPDSPTLQAERYDRWFTSAWGRYAFAVERAALLTALGPIAGLRLVDVGCGTGRFTAALETAGAHVTGVDRDPAMLAVAARRTTGRLLRGDAHALPLPDGSSDVAVAITLLEFADSAETVVDELVRVVRPGGRVVIATLNPRSAWGMAHRRSLRRPPWSDACLRTRRQLRQLVAGRGDVTMHAALYAPGALPGSAWLGPTLERAGRLAPTLGAFQIAVTRTEARHVG